MTRVDVSPLAWLDEVERQRRAAGLRRSLRARPPVGAELDLASNDYLGLSQHPDVIDGGVEALRTWGAGSTGSRLVTGNTELHEGFESALADFVGAESALVFSSGYTANLGAVVALSGPGSLLVSDALTHASLVDACRLSRARVAVTPHRDVGRGGRALASRDEERAVVITDSVFSADGVLAPLRQLHDVCRRHGALLIVDEAHGLGVRGTGGRGLLDEVGLAGAPDVVMTMTMSKALGSQGGAVLGPAAVRDHLIDAARPFIFDTGLAPAAVGAAWAALRVLDAEPWRAQAVLRHAAELARVCDVPDRPESAVVSVILGEPEVALAAATACLDRGVRVGCFRPPTVPAGTSRLRLTARASLSDDEMALARRVLTEVLTAEPLGRALVSVARHHRAPTPASARRWPPRRWRVTRGWPGSTSRCASRFRPAAPTATTTSPRSGGCPASPNCTASQALPEPLAPAAAARAGRGAAAHAQGPGLGGRRGGPAGAVDVGRGRGRSARRDRVGRGDAARSRARSRRAGAGGGQAGAGHAEPHRADPGSACFTKCLVRRAGDRCVAARAGNGRDGQPGRAVRRWRRCGRCCRTGRER